MTGLVLGAAVLGAGLLHVVSVDALARPQGADAPAYVRIARTLLATGGLELPGPGEIDPDPQLRPWDVYGSPWAIAADGRLLPKHPALFGALLVPGVAVAGVAGARVTALLLGALLAGAATAAAARRSGPAPALLAGVAVFLLSPGVRNVVWGVNVDTAIALAWLAALLLADRGRPAAAGLLGGLLLFLRPTALLLLAAVPALLLGRPWRERLRFAAGLAVPLLLLAVQSTLWWGAPWRSSYDRVAVVTGSGLRMASHSATFGGDLLDGLRILFLDPSGGLVATAPVVLVGLLGLAVSRSGDRLPAAAGAAALVAYVALAPYEFLRAVPGTSYRFALPLAAASVLPLAALLAAAGGLFRRRTAASREAA